MSNKVKPIPDGYHTATLGVPNTRAPGFRRFCGIWDGSDPGFGLLG